MIGTTVTLDMERAKELEPIKKQKYEADAKAALSHTNVDAGNYYCLQNFSSEVSIEKN